jgi:hypothetical protein
MQRDEHVPAVDTVVPAAGRGSSGWRAALAGLAVVAVLAAAVAVVATVDDDGRPLRALPLLPGSAERDAAGADAALFPAQLLELRLAGELPDLGDRGAVYRVVGADLDAARVAAMAATLGIEGEPVVGPDAFQVADADHTLSGSRSGEGPWYLWYGPGGRSVDGGTVGGATGSDGDVTDGLCEPGDEACDALLEDLRAREQAAGAEVPPIGPPTDLPSPAEAEGLARDLLTRLGVLDGADWDVTVADAGTVGVAVACPEDADAPTSCDPGETTSVLSRSVSFRRVVDGAVSSGLDWWVEVGDGGVVQSLSGTLGDLEAQGEYPLRSTRAVFDDLVSGTGWWYGDVRALAAEGDAAVTSDGATGVAEEPAPGGTTGAGTDPSGGAGTDPSGGAGDDPGVIEPEPTPEPLPEPLPEPEPVVVTVTGAERSLLLVGAFESGAGSSYLVPAYRFVGTYADGSEYRAELPALDPANVAPPTTTPPATEPAPLPEPEPQPEPVPAPGPAPLPDDLAVGVEHAYALSTHCGAKTASFDGRTWVSETFGDDALVGAPEGWGDPTDAGVLVLVEDDLARFTSSTGETLVFTPAPPDLEPDPCL